MTEIVAHGMEGDLSRNTPYSEASSKVECPNPCANDRAGGVDGDSRVHSGFIARCGGPHASEDDDMSSSEADDVEDDIDPGDEAEWAKYDLLVAEHREMCAPVLTRYA